MNPPLTFNTAELFALSKTQRALVTPQRNDNQVDINVVIITYDIITVRKKQQKRVLLES